MNEEWDHTVSSGNVFADLEVTEPEEAMAKAKLAVAISDIIARRGWTQAQAAAALRLDQPRISALMRGRLAGFSAERLMRLLTALDYNVLITVTPKTPSQSRATIAVSSTPEPIAANRG